MRMELRGEKASPGDFLSRFMDSSSNDLRPPLPQGFFLRTRDLLQPLEREEEGKCVGVEHEEKGSPSRPRGKAAPARIDINAAFASAPPSAEHLLLGAEGACRVLVKPEWSACEPPSPTATAGTAFDDPACAFSPWRKAVSPADAGVLTGRGTQQRRQQEQRQWAGRSPSPVAGGGSDGAVLSFPTSRRRPAENKRGPMVTASRSNGGFAEGEDDIFVKEEFNHKERTVNVDVGNTSDNNNEQQPSTPRSKHSATEQRRRTKINERFRTLKDLIPPNDQKRDKASLLLEVIEYIRFLQEKVQTYESSCPARTQDGAKLTPWRARQDSATAVADHPPPAPPILPLRGAGPADPDSGGGGGGGGVTPQQQAARWSPSGGRDEQVMIPAADEGLSNLSTLYSQGLVTRLTQALEGSGVDLTQASVSVRVNLGRRATTSLPERPTAEEQTETPPDRPGKRLKPDAS